MKDLLLGGICLLFIMSSCVSKKQYSAILSENEKMKNELSKDKSTIEKLRLELDGLLTHKTGVIQNTKIQISASGSHILDDTYPDNVNIQGMGDRRYTLVEFGIEDNDGNIIDVEKVWMPKMVEFLDNSKTYRLRYYSTTNPARQLDNNGDPIGTAYPIGYGISPCHWHSGTQDPCP